MKTDSLLTMFLILTSNAFGQQIICKLNGGYTDYISFVNNVPTYKYQFEILKRSSQDIRSKGGNDYQIICKNDTVDAKTINKRIWGIYQDDTLYLNGQNAIGVKNYVKVELLGKCSFLHTAYPTKHKILRELGIDTPYSDPQPEYMYGALGGLMLSLNQGKPIPLPRIPLIFDMETGKRMLLTKLNLMHLLKNYESLLNDYEAEPDNTREIILLKYLEKFNKLNY